MTKIKLSSICATTVLMLSSGLTFAESSEADAMAEKGKEKLLKQLPKKCQAKTDDFDQKVDCAQKYFMIDGQPINPMIIKDLTTLVSDKGDQVVAINLLDSQTSNKYFSDHQEVTNDTDDPYFSVKTAPTSKEEQSFEYKLEGITQDGILVIKTSEWGGGGSGVFSSLLFVRICQNAGFGDVKDDNLQLTKKRLIIEKLGEIPLEDKTKTTIKIDGNTLHIDSVNILNSGVKTSKKVILNSVKK